MNIDITGLPKSRVLIALFQNVYRKSAASLAAYHQLDSTCRANHTCPAVGVYDVPTEAQAEALLYVSGHIQEVGAVNLQIDLNQDALDLSAYDTLHQTQDAVNLLTGEECIAKLKETLMLEAADFDLQHGYEMRQALNKEAAEAQLRKFLNHADLSLYDGNLNYFTLSFFPECPDAQLHIYAQKLFELGLAVKFEKKQNILLFEAPAQLLIFSTAEEIIEKIKNAPTPSSYLPPLGDYCVIQ